MDYKDKRRRYEDYVILRDEHWMSLATEVNAFMMDGYTPTGGVTYDGYKYYFQAMVFDRKQMVEQDKEGEG